MHYHRDRWPAQHEATASPAAVRETVRFVPLPQDVNEKVWRRAKAMAVDSPRKVEWLNELERLKDLVLSGHPNGEGL